jgi:peptidoglycan/LPS O-acetylase OafA/YrhL
VAKYLTFAAFGWLTFTGTMHFAIDVVSQHLRGKRVPGQETTLYYGLNSAFALSQVLFGLLCLWLARRQPDLLREPAVVALSVLGGAAWLALTFLAMDYWEPKMNTGIFVLLLGAAIVVSRSQR